MLHSGAGLLRLPAVVPDCADVCEPADAALVVRDAAARQLRPGQPEPVDPDVRNGHADAESAGGVDHLFLQTEREPQAGIDSRAGPPQRHAVRWRGCQWYSGWHKYPLRGRRWWYRLL